MERELQRLDALEAALDDLDWKTPVPDELQSDIRMLFNEALAGGPNMNGDAGPTLTNNHARDCIWAARRIAELAARTTPMPTFGEWLDIETAPKDGTRILATDGTGYEVVAWAHGWKGLTWYDLNVEYHFPEATHWMPLPTPPDNA